VTESGHRFFASRGAADHPFAPPRALEGDLDRQASVIIELKALRESDEPRENPYPFSFAQPESLSSVKGQEHPSGNTVPKCLGYAGNWTVRVDDLCLDSEVDLLRIVLGWPEAADCVCNLDLGSQKDPVKQGENPDENVHQKRDGSKNWPYTCRLRTSSQRVRQGLSGLDDSRQAIGQCHLSIPFLEQSMHHRFYGLGEGKVNGEGERVMEVQIGFWLIIGMHLLIFARTMLLLNRFANYMEEKTDGSYATMFRLVQQIR